MRQATEQERRSIEPAIECRKFFPNAGDLWIDWFISSYGILNDSWEDGPTILSQIHERFRKAREKFFSELGESYLTACIRKWEREPVFGVDQRKNVESLLEALRKALKDKSDSTLEESPMKFGLKFAIPEVKDADQHDVIVTVDGQDSTAQKKTYPGKAKETDEMEFNAGNTVARTINSKDKDGKVLETSTITYTVTDDEIPANFGKKRVIKAVEAPKAATPDTPKVPETSEK